MNSSTRSAIDNLISSITESADRLEDCLEEDREARFRDEAEDRGADDDEPRSSKLGVRLSGHAGIRGASAAAPFNCFPSTHLIPCQEVKLMVLPRSPRVGAMGPEEAKAFGREYFTAAIESLLHWAEVCKGKTLVILTDTWPLPGSIEAPVSPVNQMLWSEEFYWHWLHHPKYFRHWHRRQELLASGSVHRIVGRILERHGIVCEANLFTSRGRLTRLPDPDPHRWPHGW